MTGDIVVAAEVIALLGRLRQACALLQAAIPTDELSPAIAGDFATACALTSDAVRRLSTQLPSPVDETLRAAATDAYRECGTDGWAVRPRNAEPWPPSVR